MSVVPILLLAACGPSVSDDTAQAPAVLLEDAVALEGLQAHLEALAQIAGAHEGNRAGSGFTASVDYAVGFLEDAGYDVERRGFTYLRWNELGPSVLTAFAGDAAIGEWADGVDILALTGSPPGDVTAPLHAVDLTLPPGESSTSGCEAGDFQGFPPGSVALIQRGTCTFGTKAANAAAAGAVAVVVFNEGQPGRRDLDRWTLGDEVGDIPVLGASFAVGDVLAAALAEGQVSVRVAVDSAIEEVASENVIADTSWGDPDQTLVIGAHLDSVVAGAGINDNGSGTALVLELAALVAEGEPLRNRLRFALWGAEEVGIVGSRRYLVDLTEGERAQIAANLNYDMIGSPNGLPLVYDGDGSDGGLPGPPGSEVLERIVADWFDGRGVAYQTTGLDGRSDYLGFLLHGIPAGGLFSGAEVAKTDDEAALHGGTPGLPHDACYHQACDDLDNIDAHLLLELSRAAAHTVRVLGTREEALGGGNRRAVSWTAGDLEVARQVAPSSHQGCGHRLPDR